MELDLRALESYAGQLAEMERTLRDLPGELGAAVIDDALFLAARDVASRIKADASFPRVTGALRRSVRPLRYRAGSRTRRPRQTSIGVGRGANTPRLTGHALAAIIEYGTTERTTRKGASRGRVAARSPVVQHLLPPKREQFSQDLARHARAVFASAAGGGKMSAAFRRRIERRRLR